MSDTSQTGPTPAVGGLERSHDLASVVPLDGQLLLVVGGANASNRRCERASVVRPGRPGFAATTGSAEPVPAT